MPQGLQTVLALLVLLPGFVSARIVRMMSARSQQSELERITEALIFSFFIYVVYVAAFGAALPLEWSGSTAHYGVVVHRGKLLVLLVLAVGMGFSWGFLKGRDLVLRSLRRLGVTERSSRESVWTDVFLTYGGTVQVGLGDGRMVLGWLRQYSETGDERTLFLERASWLSEDGIPVAIDGDGLLLLTEKAEIRFVMFLDEDQI